MSEYQYYEFLAIDHALTEEETNTVRTLSTRAQITPVSFINEYNWGDFKSTRTHWIITWCLEESENYDRFGMEDGRGWMARLALLRDELQRGDLRSLYIGWLSSVSRGTTDLHEKEPLSVYGLGSLTAPQKALAQFLEIDPDLMDGAGIDNPAVQAEEIPEKEMEEWINGLSGHKVKGVMKQLLAGKNARILQEEKRRKKRDAYLENLANDFPKIWKSLQKTVKRGSGLAYDEVCRSIVDISEAYKRFGNRKHFQKELKKFMSNHMRRKALIQRLEKAGIWKEK